MASKETPRRATDEIGVNDVLRVTAEERRIQKEETRQTLETQQRLIEAMMARTEVREPPKPTPQVTLPRLKEGGDVESFLTALEMTLTIAETPKEEWKHKLISSLPVESIARITSTVTIEGADYEELAEALRGSSAITFCSAAEDLSSGEKGKIFTKEIRAAASRMVHLHKTVAKEAYSVQEMAKILTVVRLRDNLVPELKTYIDTGKRFQFNDFVAACEEWVRSQPGEVSCFKKQRSQNQAPVRGLGNSHPQSNQSLNRQRPTCCGKVGHLARECRSRPPVLEAVTAPAAREATTAPISSSRSSGVRGSGEVTCFRCNKKGHKSPDCPTRPRGNRRVQVPDRKPVPLHDEEVFGSLNGCDLPVTIDTGAQITIVLIECVQDTQMMGRKMIVKSFQGSSVEGEACIVSFEFGGRYFEREAVAVPGDTLNWTPCLQVSLSEGDDLDFLRDLARRKSHPTGEHMCVRPVMERGKLMSGYMVSGPDVIVEDTNRHSESANPMKEEKAIKAVEMDDTPETVEQVMEDLGRIEVEEGSRSSSVMEEESSDHGQVEGGIREDEASVLGEDIGSALGGRAEMGLVVNGMKDELPRTALAEATASDDSLQMVKQLAKSGQQGYRYDQGMVLRDRLDDKGENVTQVCVPAQFRGKCLSLVHTSFGHQGRNKMVSLLRPYFYWPRQARDCVNFIKGCKICQSFDKENPPRGRMQMHEIVSTPFERGLGGSISHRHGWL